MVLRLPWDLAVLGTDLRWSHRSIGRINPGLIGLYHPVFGFQFVCLFVCLLVVFCGEGGGGRGTFHGRSCWKDLSMHFSQHVDNMLCG